MYKVQDNRTKRIVIKRYAFQGWGWDRFKIHRVHREKETFRESIDSVVTSPVLIPSKARKARKPLPAEFIHYKDNPLCGLAEVSTLESYPTYVEEFEDEGRKKIFGKQN